MLKLTLICMPLMLLGGCYVDTGGHGRGHGGWYQHGEITTPQVVYAGYKMVCNHSGHYCKRVPTHNYQQHHYDYHS